MRYRNTILTPRPGIRSGSPLERHAQRDGSETGRAASAELGYNFRWLDDGGYRFKHHHCYVDEFGRGKDVFFNQIVAAAAGWTNDESDEEPRLCYGGPAVLIRMI